MRFISTMQVLGYVHDIAKKTETSCSDRRRFRYCDFSVVLDNCKSVLILIIKIVILQALVEGDRKLATGSVDLPSP